MIQWQHDDVTKKKMYVISCFKNCALKSEQETSYDEFEVNGFHAMTKCFIWEELWNKRAGSSNWKNYAHHIYHGVWRYMIKMMNMGVCKNGHNLKLLWQLWEWNQSKLCGQGNRGKQNRRGVRINMHCLWKAHCFAKKRCKVISKFFGKGIIGMSQMQQRNLMK